VVIALGIVVFDLLWFILGRPWVKER